MHGYEKEAAEMKEMNAGRCFLMKEKEDSALALVCAGGDALDVKLLHDDEQDGDGNGIKEALADQVAQTGERTGRKPRA